MPTSVDKTSPRYYLLATLAASGLTFFLHTLFYRLTWELHFVEFARSAPQKGLLVAEYLVFGGLLTFIYPHGYRGGSVWGEGFRFGAVMGALSFIPIGLSIRAAWQVPLNFGFYVAALNAIVSGGLTGILIAAIHRSSLRLEPESA